MPNCKYIKQQEIVSYNGGVDWQNVMPAQYRKGQLIEHDSEDCGELDVIYRWRKLTGVYLCVDDVKYEKLILDESYDGGLSWYPAYPSQYTTGEEIGVDEDYCNDKFVGHYILTDDDAHHDCPRNHRWNGFECVYIDPIKVVKCDGNPELTRTDTAYYSSYSSYWFLLVSVEIGDCVTSIGENAFRSYTSLSGMNTTIPGELNIPSGVTSIGDRAFYNCSGITSIICNPTTPPSIGYNAFYGTNNCPIYVPCGSFWAYMDSWSNLDYRLNPIGGESCIPMRARYDYNGGFRTYYCRGTDTVVDSGDTDGIGVERSAITGVYIGSCATAIDNSAFSGCGFSAITIPSGVTSIGSSAFHSCSSLTSVTIENGVTSIGSSAFYGCSGLTSVTIPNSVTSIGNDAFSRCISLPVEGYIRYADTYAIEATDKSLTSYTLKNNTRWINNWAFAGCSALTSITIPDSVTSIGDNAFYRCSGLTSIDIPDSVTSIGTMAFHECSGLTSATIGNGVTSIGARAFSDCSKLGSISIPSGVASIGEYTFYNCTGLTSCTIGTGITSIDKAAFMDCSGLTSIDIPDSVTSIGDIAFGYCSGLTSVTIGNSVTTIGSAAFRYCTRLTSVTMQNSVTRIGYEAFQGCTRLRSVTIPNSVTTIGYEAFYNCSGLQSVTVLATTPPTLGSSTVFYGSTCPIYVPASSVEAYKAAGNWRAYASRIQAIIQAIPKWLATYSDSSVTSAECGSSSAITSGEITLRDLVSVEIGDCVTNIGDIVFGYCSSLTSVTIPSSVTSIGVWTFAGCGGLTSITIPDSVTSIGDYAFNGCSGLTSIDIPSGVTSIDDGVFAVCTSLTSITIPDSVTSIGASAFNGCSGLASITIPDSVTSIGDYAFNGCSGLTSITVEPTTPPTIGGSVFGNTNNCPIYVPAASVETYKAASGWSTYSLRIQAIT